MELPYILLGNERLNLLFPGWSFDNLITSNSKEETNVAPNNNTIETESIMPNLINSFESQLEIVTGSSQNFNQEMLHITNEMSTRLPDMTNILLDISNHSSLQEEKVFLQQEQLNNSKDVKVKNVTL